MAIPVSTVMILVDFDDQAKSYVANVQFMKIITAFYSK